MKLLHQFQLNESFLPYAEAFLDLLHQFHLKESENAGIISMKIIMDWHRHFKGALESKVPAFIEYVRGLYDNMQVSIQEHFNVTNKNEETKIIIDSDEDNEIPAIHSFRVLAEAPIDIVILFQIHRKWMTENIGLILPSVVKVII